MYEIPENVLKFFSFPSSYVCILSDPEGEIGKGWHFERLYFRHVWYLVPWSKHRVVFQLKILFKSVVVGRWFFATYYTVRRKVGLLRIREKKHIFPLKFPGGTLSAKKGSRFRAKNFEIFSVLSTKWKDQDITYVSIATIVYEKISYTTWDL